MKVSDTSSTTRVLKERGNAVLEFDEAGAGDGKVAGGGVAKRWMCDGSERLIISIASR